MHEEHLRLHGKTYDYKVLYKHIHRQFLLPRADQMYQQLIVSHASMASRRSRLTGCCYGFHV